MKISTVSGICLAIVHVSVWFVVRPSTRLGTVMSTACRIASNSSEFHPAKVPSARPQKAAAGALRWSTFLRTHARGILAYDFLGAVTVSFHLLYVFVVIEHGSRRLLHLNVTGHPSAAWTLQQLREVSGLESRYRFLIHDRDSIFSTELDRSIVSPVIFGKWPWQFKCLTQAALTHGRGTARRSRAPDRAGHGSRRRCKEFSRPARPIGRASGRRS